MQPQSPAPAGQLLLRQGRPARHQPAQHQVARHRSLKITANTNVLARALVQDDPDQAGAASSLMEQAEPVARLCMLG
jgi:hypothetical protein